MVVSLIFMNLLKTGIHSARLLLRRPYKLLLCCLVNLVVILFTVIEGIQMTETRAAIKAAMGRTFQSFSLIKNRNCFPR